MNRTCRFIIVPMLVVSLLACQSWAGDGGDGDWFGGMDFSGMNFDFSELTAYIVIGVVIVGLAVVFLGGYLISHKAHPKAPAQFAGEAVTFTVLPEGSVHVSANFSIFNPRHKAYKLPITFPFPNDDYLSPPQNPVALVRCETGPKSLPVLMSKREWRFDLPLDSADTSQLHLEYDQTSTTASFKYLLTPPRSWSQRLNNASFTIQLPQNYQLTSASYDYRQASEPDNCSVYTITLTDLTPSVELEFSWQPTVPISQAPHTDKILDPRKNHEQDLPIHSCADACP
jgi:hypothetical protein